MIKEDNILIKNVRIVDTDNDYIGNVYINNGIIDFTKNEELAYKEIDGKGKVLLPAFIDLHAHFRDPGYTYKEDIESGSKAAVRGGYTTSVLMANTNPICSTMDTVNYVKDKAKKVDLIDVEQVVSITDDLKGEKLDHIKNLDDSIKFISDDGKGVMDDEIMKEALKISSEKNLVIMSHAEDPKYSKTDMRKAENYMTKRDIDLLGQIGGNLHMCHVSTKEAIEMIIEAKKRRLNVTCEITPHHLFTDEKISYRVNPPIRNQEDVTSIINAIKDGYVDTVSTDHAPHTKEDKINGSPGISGIETSFQLCLTQLVKENHISLNKLSELMSKRPAEIMNIKKGLIKPGYNGDVVLVDIDKESKIDVNNFISKGKNSPFDGLKVFGEILITIKEGKIVYNKADE